MKKLLPLLAALLMVGAAWAQEEQAPVQKLNVHMMDGQVVTFLLDDETELLVQIRQPLGDELNWT